MIPTRRTRPAEHGRHVDALRTVREALRRGGELAAPALEAAPRATARRSSRCVTSPARWGATARCCCASCTRCSRTAAAARCSRSRPTSRTSRARSQDRDVDRALAEVGREVTDWASGTRLGACLREFNQHWSRRVLAQGAIVLLVTDGLDRDDAGVLRAEAARLGRSCRRLIWLNPLLRYAGFEPKAQGIQALLPAVDEHRPIHDLASLEQLARALSDQDCIHKFRARSAGIHRALERTVTTRACRPRARDSPIALLRLLAPLVRRRCRASHRAALDRDLLGIAEPRIGMHQ